MFEDNPIEFRTKLHNSKYSNIEKNKLDLKNWRRPKNCLYQGSIEDDTVNSVVSQNFDKILLNKPFTKLDRRQWSEPSGPAR